MTLVRFHDEARLELIEQVAYYEAAREGLGEAFNAEVEAVVEVVSRNPNSGLRYNFNTLRAVLKKFPRPEAAGHGRADCQSAMP